MTAGQRPLQMTPSEVAALRAANPDLAILDVREAWEVEICAIPGSRNIPMGQVPNRMAEVPEGDPLVVVCHHGGRSLQVTQFLRSRGVDRAINLAGGVDGWAREVDPAMARY